MSVRLGSLGEFGFLRRLWSALDPPGAGVILGSGDDAAVLAPAEGVYLLVSTDAVVEGRHFRREWLTSAQIGERAGRAALSDLAAMGGLPRALLASVAFPPDLSAEEAEQLLWGVDRAAQTGGIRLVGGDLVASPGPLFLDVVAVGETPHPWTRSGAHPGEVLLVSGELGASAAALHLLQAGTPLDRLPPPLAERFLRPSPAFDLVRALQPLKAISAAIDLSDGLLADLEHVAERSGVGLSLRAASVPRAPAAEPVWAAAGEDPLARALTSGEEYELALTVPADRLAEVLEAAASAGARVLTVVGEVGEGQGVTVEGGPPAESLRGWDHFRG